MHQQNSALEIVEAGPADIDALVPLFVGYREFYRGLPEVERSRQFLLERLLQKDTVIFLAWLKEGESRQAAGFVQLFPSLSTGTLKRIWILNDLFIDLAASRRGVGGRLMEHARCYALETQASRLTLKTEVTKQPAQAQYASLVWKRDERFLPYDLPL